MGDVPLTRIPSRVPSCYAACMGNTGRRGGQYGNRNAAGGRGNPYGRPGERCTVPEHTTLNEASSDVAALLLEYSEVSDEQLRRGARHVLARVLVGDPISAGPRMSATAVARVASDVLDYLLKEPDKSKLSPDDVLRRIDSVLGLEESDEPAV